MKELLEYIVKAIVEEPEQVETMVIESGATVVLELKVAKSDVGKVIGRQGNMARALRTILSNAATKLKRRVVLQILD